MTTTEKYGLKKPDKTDFYNVDIQNENMDIIEQRLVATNESLADGKVKFRIVDGELEYSVFEE